MFEVRSELDENGDPLIVAEPYEGWLDAFGLRIYGAIGINCKADDPSSLTVTLPSQEGAWVAALIEAQRS